MNKNIELLAPAGTYEAFVAAIENGADVVYMGGKHFNARANATNFDIDEDIQKIQNIIDNHNSGQKLSGDNFTNGHLVRPV